MFSGDEHEIHCLKPHGNSKRKIPFRRTFQSTTKRLKESLNDKEKTVKSSLDQAYRAVGDVIGARSLGQLPRGPVDIYNARRSARNEKEMQNVVSFNSEKSAGSVKLDGLWTLLERAKREAEFSSEEAFIRECTVHPNLSVVLASDRQLKEIGQFCTNPTAFTVLEVDPTFNIFDVNLSLTVTTYRNLRLRQKQTGKPPVFIGPLFIHQRKDWQSYSKFANRLRMENPVLDSILACGTDGERALIDGFKRNFKYAVFLRCFIHFKDNLEREMKKKRIFSKQQAPYFKRNLWQNRWLYQTLRIS